jgi:diacylglycerol kinase (ATP)
VATGPWGECYFIEGIGTGLLTCSIPEVDEGTTIAQLADARVRVTYAQQIFRDQLADCPAIEVEATCDGEDVSGRYLLFEVLNMAYIGPNLFLAPGIVRRKGEFDLVLLDEKHRSTLHDHIEDWQKGKPWPAEFGARRCRRLKIKWSGFTVHIDDKLWPTKEDKKPKLQAMIDVTVEPGAIEFLVPKEVDKVKQIEKAQD